MSDNCNCGCDNHTHHTNEESKYDFVLAEYGKAMTDDEVAAKVKKLIEERVEENFLDPVVEICFQTFHFIANEVRRQWAAVGGDGRGIIKLFF